MRRLFLDSNVLFTAGHNHSGKASLVIELGAKKHWKVLTSTYAAEEARRNIALKFPDSLPRLETLLSSVTVLPSGVGRPCPIDLPLKDRVIFGAALQGNATHLLTGDGKHFGPLMNSPAHTCGITIQTIAEFLAAIA